jgi:ABC-type nitrate/sulfonate/bicarbonate transport system permease component
MTNVARGGLVPIGLLLVWEVAGRLGAIPVESLSMPSRMWTAGVVLLRDGVLLSATTQTLHTTLEGLALATLLGVAVGIIFGLFPRMQGVVGPTLEVLRPVPPVAFIPLALLIFGFGVALEVSIIVLASVWPVLIVTVAAVRGIDPRLIEVGRVLELSLARRIKTIVLPATAARIGVGVRIAAGVALVVAITVEIVLNPRGLGYEMIVAQQKLQVDILFALILWTGCVGVLFNFLVANVERRWLPRVS